MQESNVHLLSTGTRSLVNQTDALLVALCQSIGDTVLNSESHVVNTSAALFEELCEHPTTGTGKVEQLKVYLEGYWSRRINKSSRLIYKIEEETITVIVVSIKGHYGDK